MDSIMEQKWIKHYCNNHMILLVGEGDFSFALSLANAFGSASNMVATSLDSKESLIIKYSRASTILDELEKFGCNIVHEVDAHSFHNHPMLRNRISDRIIYNFPHAGFDLAENNLNQIRLHQEVVWGFLKCAKKMLTKDGEVHITHKNANPFCKWEIVKLADKIGLVFVEKTPFQKCDYPGYVNKRGSGEKCDGTFLVGDSSTFKFSKPKYVKPLSLGLPVLLEDSESIQLKNYANKIMCACQNQKSQRIDSKMEGRWIKHYSSCHRILLVGEGDFSFALCLARAFCNATNLVATSLDSKVVVAESTTSAILRPKLQLRTAILNHTQYFSHIILMVNFKLKTILLSVSVKGNSFQAFMNMINLERLGCTILHEVDAHSMYQHPMLLHKLFDRIVFNFPQAAEFDFPEYKPYKIRHHQKLVLGFLRSAMKMLSCDGEVHVTLKTTYPFIKWGVVNLAEKAGLVLIEKVPFKMGDYPGYTNKRGSGPNWNENFDVGRCSTYKFSKARDVEFFVGLSDVFVDPNSVELKDASDCELKLVSEDQDVQDYISANSTQANSAKNSNLISMCTIL